MDKHKLLRRLFLLVIFTTLSFSCRSSPTAPHTVANLQLSVQDVACREVWLKASFSLYQGASSSFEFKISRDGETLLTGDLLGTDTTVVDTTVQAAKTYNYEAYLYRDTQLSGTSLPLQVTTLDSTTDNFTWQVFTFGGAASSYLYDVSIVNDSDVWAVGAIYVDSADGQPDPYPYNAIQWNGHSWKLAKINFYTIWGQSYMTALPARAVFGLDERHVWIVSSNSQIAECSGSSQDTTMSLPVSANKLWAADTNFIFAAGNGGVAYYDGYTWQKLASPTAPAIQDIWGRTDGTAKQPQVFAVASNLDTPYQKAVLELTPNSADSLNTAGLNWSLRGIWSPDPWHYYICGDGIFENNFLDAAWRFTQFQSGVYTEAIRGNAVNDFVIVGDFGFLAHYNGSTLRQFNGNGLPNFSGQYNSVDMKGNMIIAVGWEATGKAIAAIGWR